MQAAHHCLMWFCNTIIIHGCVAGYTQPCCKLFPQVVTSLQTLSCIKFDFNRLLQLDDIEKFAASWVSGCIIKSLQINVMRSGCNIWTMRASVSPGCLFGYPGGTWARVVYMASQMNRDVTGRFGWLIWIKFLTKPNGLDFAYVIKIFEEDH